MFLKRVKVDDFRVLKNVDLTFEPDFVPSTFPLGSLNGGGKSTLLQLIFTLLHCSFDEAKHEYLVNLLSPIVNNKPDNFVLSQFDIIHESKEFSLEFILAKDGYQGLDTTCFSRLLLIKD
jgi:ABC-type Mn2+/Zn2+ transport system ATPase subunit